MQEPLLGSYLLELRHSVIDMNLNGGLGDVVAVDNGSFGFLKTAPF